MYNRQTLAGPVTIEGVGLHSGRSTRLRLLPAKAGSGIVFVRTDAGRTEIPADLAHAGPSFYATVIRQGGLCQSASPGGVTFRAVIPTRLATKTQSLTVVEHSL